MSNYIYNGRGQAVGFLQGNYLYDIKGNPVGQMGGTHVYQMISGDYVGESDHDMVVDKGLGMGSIGGTGPSSVDGHSVTGRGSVNCAYSDVWHKLVR